MEPHEATEIRGACLCTPAIAIGAAAPAAAQRRDPAAVLDAKVTALYKAGKYSDAMPLAQRVLPIREKTFGPDHLELKESSARLCRTTSPFVL